MASRPSHIYASTLRRRDYVWSRRRRRVSGALSSPLGSSLALTLSTVVGVVIAHLA